MLELTLSREVCFSTFGTYSRAKGFKGISKRLYKLYNRCDNRWLTPSTTVAKAGDFHWPGALCRVLAARHVLIYARGHRSNHSTLYSLRPNYRTSVVCHMIMSQDLVF